MSRNDRSANWLFAQVKGYDERAKALDRETRYGALGKPVSGWLRYFDRRFLVISAEGQA